MQQESGKIQTDHLAGAGGSRKLHRARHEELAVAHRPLRPLPHLEAGDRAVGVRAHRRRERDAILRPHVVVGDYGDADETIDVGEEALQPLTHEAADGVRAVGSGRGSVDVEAGDAGTARGHALGCQARADTGLLETAEPRIVDPRRRGRPLARPGVRLEASHDEIQVVIGQAAPHLVVRIRQAAVQPEAGSLDGTGGEDDHPGLLGRGLSGADVSPRDPGRGHGPALTLALDTHRERVRDQRGGLATRPPVGGQRHGDIARVSRALRAQVARRLQRLDTALRTMAAECAALGTRVRELLAVSRTTGRPLGLQDCVLLRPECRPCDVLRGLDREAELRGGTEKELLLRPHRRRLHRQRVLDPVVVGHELPVTEWKEVLAVVRAGVGACVIVEDAGHRPGRVREVVHGGAAHARRLPEKAVLRQIACPRRLRAIAGAEAKDPGGGVVRLVLQVRPFPFAVRELRAGLEKQHIESAGRQLFGDDRSRTARADDDDVTHADPPPSGLPSSP